MNKYSSNGPIGTVAQTAIDLLKQAPYAINTLLYSGADAHSQAEKYGIELNSKPESFALFILPDKTALLLGSDDTGLLYAANELIDNLAANHGNIDAIHSISQKPFTKTRGLYKFIHNADIESEWFYSKEYWLWWFDSMAANRYNSFNLVFSHQTYYLAPMFAYFIDMPEFPGICPLDATPLDIRRNHDMLQFISRTAAERGITFIIGIWQMCAWKGNENDWRPVQPGTVKGLTSDNLQAYIYAGMAKMIKQFPYIGGLQIRANEESGISKEKQIGFFRDSLFKAMAESDRPFIFDFRCWMAEEETIQNAIDMIPGTRLSVKYWAEFMGAPYQPAKISPGYSYSDYLRLPLQTDFIYQVWSLGSPRLFVWGDPDYVRRFVYSTTLGGAHGFEINLQLAQKGYGNEPGAWRIFANEENEYYKWEEERYWLYMLLFGRLSYDPDACAETWLRPMRARFGDKAEQVMAAVQAGSAVLPYLVQASLSDPNMYIWPEIDLGGMLDFYIQTPTSDACVIDTIPQYVDRWLQGEISGLFSPIDSSNHFKKMAEDAFIAVKELEDVADSSKELFATILDVKAGAFLAKYHSHKILAGLHLKFYYETKDRQALRVSLDELRKARICWEQLIALTQGHYHDHMVTGPTDAGCWKTKLVMLYEDEMRVAEILRLSEKNGNFMKAFDFGAPIKPPPYHVYGDYFTVYADYTVERGYDLVSNETAYTAEAGYGWIEGMESIEAIEMPLIRVMDNHMDEFRRDSFTKYPVNEMKGWRNSLTEDGLSGTNPATLQIDLPDGCYQVSLLISDETINARSHGPMNIGIADTLFSNISLLPLQEKTLSADVTVKGVPLIISLSGNWFVSGLLVYPDKPIIASTPYHVIDLQNDEISATVTAPRGVSSVELVLNEVPHPMCYQRPEEYVINIKSLVEGKADGTYYIKATDNQGNVASTKPVSFLHRTKKSCIHITHEPVCNAPLNEAIKLSIQVDSENPLQAVNLCYSAVNHFIPVTTLPMILKDGSWVAEIPAGAFDKMWDILYYFEVVDMYGSGIIYPDFRERTPYYVIEMQRKGI